MPIAPIESLDREGRGVSHVEGKTLFVEGAVPGETVEFSSYRKKPSWELAQVVRIEKEGTARVAPRCAFFGTCGGGSMPHGGERARGAGEARLLAGGRAHIGRTRARTRL